MKVFFILIAVMTCGISLAQNEFSVESIVAFQEKMNQHFADSTESPLTKADLVNFKKLEYFTPNENFFVIAKLVRTPNAKPFEMQTTTSRRPKYVKYGVLHFKLEGKKFKLNVYQNADLPRNPLYKNTLFLPFTDRTSGVESYGGGRYIDLFIPEGNTIAIDFNKAYNPYCAYNVKYSCPVVPAENDLNIEVKAGVKNYVK